MKCDLHCHTKLSDGSLGIEELISLAKRTGLKAVAITDHDTLAGANRAKIIGDRYDITVIPGVEISCFDYKRNRKAHLLCYLCDKPDRLESLFRKTYLNRKKAAEAMVEKIMERYPVLPSMIVNRAKGSSNIYKQHIMHALMDIGAATSIYGDLYRELFDPKEGFAFVEPEYPDVFEVLAQVKDAGGIAVLAHPTHYDSYDLLGELVAHGLDGVEVWHPCHDEFDVQRIRDVAKKHGLLMTGGSDFHGMYNKAAMSLGACYTPLENFEALLAYKSRRKTRETIII